MDPKEAFKDDFDHNDVKICEPWPWNFQPSVALPSVSERICETKLIVEKMFKSTFARSDHHICIGTC